MRWLQDRDPEPDQMIDLPYHVLPYLRFGSRGTARMDSDGVEVELSEEGSDNGNWGQRTRAIVPEDTSSRGHYSE